MGMDQETLADTAVQRLVGYRSYRKKKGRYKFWKFMRKSDEDEENTVDSNEVLKRLDPEPREMEKCVFVRTHTTISPG